MPDKTKVPVKLIRLDDQSFHLMIEGKINDIPVNLVIDTGASKTVFDKKILGKKLSSGSKKRPDIHSAGITADQIKSSMAIANVFRLGDFKVKNFPVILIDLEAINKLYNKVTGKTIHGLLGSDFLLKMRAAIDYKKLMLILREPL